MEAEYRYMATTNAPALSSHLKGEKMTTHTTGGIKTYPLIILMVLNGFLWFWIEGIDLNRSLIATFIIGIFIAFSFILFARGRLNAGFAMVAFLAALQPAIREYAVQLPYLALEYITIIFAGIFFFVNQKRLKFNFPMLLYGIYITLETIGLFNTFSFTYARGVYVPSLTLFLFLVISGNHRWDKLELKTILAGYLVGVTGIAAIVGKVYLSGTEIVWLSASNFQASGDMGPVQISMLLSIAIAVCFLFFEADKTIFRFFFAAMSALFGFLMILSFSRNGIYLLVIFVFVYLMVFRKPSLKLLIGFAGITLVSYVVFQNAQEITLGQVSTRYQDFSSTNRVELIRIGYKIFQENPVLGVGTGNYYSEVSKPEYFGVSSGAHNELVRAASEHGIIGFLSWLGFLISSIFLILRESSGRIRGGRMAFLAVAVAYSFVNGHKLLMQSVLYMLALTPIAEIPNKNEDNGYYRSSE